MNTNLRLDGDKMAMATGTRWLNHWSNKKSKTGNEYLYHEEIEQIIIQDESLETVHD